MRQHALESRHAVAIVRWKVRAGVKRPAIRREKNRHRPSAVTGHELHGLHVDRVDVGPLLAIDFDRYEALVQSARDLVVLERLALHDVTPVAR